MPRAFPPEILSKRTRSRLFGCGLTAIAVLGLIPVGNPGRSGSLGSGSLGLGVAEAQNFGQRILQGKVIGEGDSPVGGATVFLKNLKSRDIKSFTSIQDGSFRFAQVGMVDDYEVWAEQGKKKSGVKTISSFDSRKLVEFDLKLK
jgi:hypothetical protein